MIGVEHINQALSVEIDARGAGPLAPLLTRIRAIKTRRDLNLEITALHRVTAVVASWGMLVSWAVAYSCSAISASAVSVGRICLGDHLIELRLGHVEQ